MVQKKAAELKFMPHIDKPLKLSDMLLGICGDGSIERDGSMKIVAVLSTFSLLVRIKLTKEVLV